MMRKTAVSTIFLLLLAMLFLLSGCSSAKTDRKPAEITSEEEENTGAKAADKTLFGQFSSYTQDGEEVTQDIFSQADLTMVNIWGTFCGPCIQEMPELGELADEYAEKNVAVVGIISDVTEYGNETAQEIIDQTGADYMHIVLSQELYDNYLWQIQVVPTTVFVDSNGMRVGDVVMGAKDKDSWSAEIDARLEALSDAES